MDRSIGTLMLPLSILSLRNFLKGRTVFPRKVSDELRILSKKHFGSNGPIKLIRSEPSIIGGLALLNQH